MREHTAYVGAIFVDSTKGATVNPTSLTVFLVKRNTGKGLKET